MRGQCGCGKFYEPPRRLAGSQSDPRCDDYRLFCVCGGIMAADGDDWVFLHCKVPSGQEPSRSHARNLNGEMRRVRTTQHLRLVT